VGTDASRSNGEGPQSGGSGEGGVPYVVARLGELGLPSQQAGQPGLGMVRHQGTGAVREPSPEEKARAMGFPEGLLLGGKAREEQENALVGNAINLNALTFLFMALTQEGRTMPKWPGKGQSEVRRL